MPSNDKRPCVLCDDTGKVRFYSRMFSGILQEGVCWSCKARIQNAMAHQRHPDTTGKRAGAIRGTNAEMKGTGDE